MVKNVKETIKFYEEKLGFKKVLSVPEEGETLNFAIFDNNENIYNILLIIQKQTRNSLFLNV